MKYSPEITGEGVGLVDAEHVAGRRDHRQQCESGGSGWRILWLFVPLGQRAAEFSDYPVLQGGP
jgi:hypothetical protein